MSTATSAPVPEAPRLSEPARIVNTYIAPSKTFTDIGHNASWWGPWLLISVVSLLFMVAMQRQVGFMQASRNIVEHSSRAEAFEKLPPEQQERQLAVSIKFMRGFSYGTPLTLIVIYAIIAAVLMATFNFGAGARVKYKTALAIVFYGALPGVISGLLAIVTLFAGADPESFDIRNPVASNPAYAMDAAGNQFAYAMASALDVFIIWNIVLIGIGFACNSKVKRSTAIMIVAGWYLVYKLGGAGLAALFS